jgi:hypothetical protein
MQHLRNKGDKMRHSKMMYSLTGCLALGLAGQSLAWLPKLDDTAAKAIVDGVYRRGPDVPTSSSLSLEVKNGVFEAGANAVEAYSGDTKCLTDWQSKPKSYSTLGSRPTAMAVAGQSDFVKSAAIEARDNFKTLTASAALELARTRLPDNHLRVFMKIEGLEKDTLRDAYQVGALDSNNKIVAPYQINFLDDWASGGTPRATWSGTMVYYFNFSKNPIDGNGTLKFLLRTEADSDCAYKINLNLAAFK